MKYMFDTLLRKWVIHASLNATIVKYKTMLGGVGAECDAIKI